ncbi:MAG: ABC transporter ATP-binding protein [Flavobacteriaceae bacterium]|nr:ABC transporter ATP-binding protein [Flavobacteriaceae bacterium]
MLNKYFKHFSFFFSYLRHRIFVSMGLNISVGLLDGFGLVMFLPMLQMVDGDKTASANDLGNLSFLIEGIKGLGFEIDLKNVLIFMLLFFILKGGARFLESYYRTVVQNYFVRSLRVKSIYFLRDFSFKNFVYSDSGRIQNTLSGEVGRVAGASNSYFSTLQSAIMVLVYSVLAFMANPQFAIMVFIGGLFSNFIFNVINKKTIEASRRITREGHDFQGLLIQKVSFFKYLKATGLIDQFTEKLKEIIISIDFNNRKIGFFGAILYATREPLIMTVAVAVILLQTMVFGQSLGLIILSLLFFYRALTYLMTLQTFYNTFLTSAGALENMQEFLRELEMNTEDYSGESIKKFEKFIDLNYVSFAYGDTPVLKNIRLTINKNESIALVGESGSGKTTLINLITGLLPVDSGDIRIDGKLYSSLDIKSLQHRIGYITQEPVIFSDSVYNNVTFWSAKSPENLDRFWMALEKANIAEFVRQLPEKENSLLGNNGILVSGGQKQRISIARELYKEIDILIMDEATSALDSETEKIIQENIEDLIGKITLIIVAHRLSTIKNVDRVILLSKGEITASDRFKDLVEKSPDFKRMVALQTF